MTDKEALALVRKGKYAEADEKIIGALEKQIPKEPKTYEVGTNLPTGEAFTYEGCPTCGTLLDIWNFKYCICRCGQKIKDYGTLEGEDERLQARN